MEQYDWWHQNFAKSFNPLTSIGNNSSQENSPRNSPDFATSLARLSWPACSRHTAACMHRFFHIFGRPGQPAVWFMSESGAVGSWQARTYLGLPITSSGFEAAAVVRGLNVREKDIIQYNTIQRTVFLERLTKNKSYLKTLYNVSSVILSFSRNEFWTGEF